MRKLFKHRSFVLILIFAMLITYMSLSAAKVHAAEDDDTISTGSDADSANVMTNGASYKIYSGGKHIWFAYTMEKDGYIEFKCLKIDNPDANGGLFWMNFYDSSMNFLSDEAQEIRVGSDLEKPIHIGLAAGTYYIEIWTPSFDKSTLSMNVNWTYGLAEKEPNDNYDKATPIEKEKYYTFGQMNWNDANTDCFKANLTLGNTYELRIKNYDPDCQVVYLANNYSTLTEKNSGGQTEYYYVTYKAIGTEETKIEVHNNFNPGKNPWCQIGIFDVTQSVDPDPDPEPEPEPEPDPEPDPDPGIVDGDELLLEIPETSYYLGDGNKVYHGAIEAVTENGYTYKTLNNYNAVSSFEPIGYCFDDFDNDGEKELLSVYTSSSDRKAELRIQKIVDGKVVTKASQTFDGINVILEKADRAEFDVFIIERNGRKYICLESDGVNDFFEESRTSQFLMVSYDPDKSGIKKFTEVISHSDEVDYYYDGMGDEIQNQLRNYGIYINGDSYVSGGCRVIDFVNNKKVVCGARTLPTHPAVTIDYGARTYYYLDYDAIKAGDEFTSISFFNTNDLSERNDPGYLYRIYNRMNGEHFYTTDRAEKMYLMQIGWSYEGILCKVPEKSNTPVYRLYNPNSGEHHYTPDPDEKNMLVRVGWNYEGIGWYSDDSKKIPIHRLYNPNAVGIYEAGSHHYTSDESEAAYLNSIGWRREGEGWYGSNEVVAFY